MVLHIKPNGHHLLCVKPLLFVISWEYGDL